MSKVQVSLASAGDTSSIVQIAIPTNSTIFVFIFFFFPLPNFFHEVFFCKSVFDKTFLKSFTKRTFSSFHSFYLHHHLLFYLSSLPFHLWHNKHFVLMLIKRFLILVLIKIKSTVFVMSYVLHNIVFHACSVK